MIKEWKIGEVRKVNGHYFKCIKSKHGCKGCVA